jgi:hypothetical protein
MYKRKVVGHMQSSDDRYEDLELDCGHLWRYPKRRNPEDYPKTLNRQQCKEERQIAKEEQEERERQEALAILDKLMGQHRKEKRRQ